MPVSEWGFCVWVGVFYLFVCFFLSVSCNGALQFSPTPLLSLLSPDWSWATHHSLLLSLNTSAVPSPKMCSPMVLRDTSVQFMYVTGPAFLDIGHDSKSSEIKWKFYHYG